MIIGIFDLNLQCDSEASLLRESLFNAIVAQLVEHQLPKLRVTSSSLAYRSHDKGSPFRAAFVV